jgi:hydroxyethylthiazole kinase
MQVDPQGVWIDIQTIKKNSPIIHYISENVPSESAVSSLLAIGASTTACSFSEIEETSLLARSFIVNVAHSSPTWIRTAISALYGNYPKGCPIIFDPCGTGNSPYRTEAVHSLLDQQIVTIVRGNIEEITLLNSYPQLFSEAVNCLNVFDYLEQAKELAIEKGHIVWMSGEIDLITNGETLAFIYNGHGLMEKVCGMGSIATAMTAAFLAVNPDSFLGTVHAAVLMGVAGEIAAQKGSGPGSFHPAFIDALYNISVDQIQERIRVETLC